ncbi:MAG: nucleoside triphosphate pyrophosphohydrolase family protein [Patescibacteria group bacterium]|jgi:NTP pyrophosphatase (non-canonical NTP hydrolase)
MDFDNYQKEAKKTAIYPDRGKNFIYPTLGLVGEAGEIAEKIKKIIRDEKGLVSEEKRKELNKELGDVLWYLANLADELNLSLEEIAKANLTKLASRQKRNCLHGDGDNR